MDLFNIIKELEARANTARALDMSRYMKNKFPFFGIQAPIRDEICKPYFKDAKKEKKIDWDFVEYCCLQKSLEITDFEKLKKLVIKKSWWDTVDILDRIIGSLIYRDETLKKEILKWSVDDNIWLRRVAIDHQLLRKEKTDTDLLGKILVNNLNHTEFFINKAIGWALRDYSKTNPQWVKDFIEKYKNNMASLSIREASKYI